MSDHAETQREIERYVAGIRHALELEPWLLDDDVRSDAALLLEKVEARMTLGDGKTVVAFAGSTGSGKSSLFNAVAGLDIAEVGIRRPTTSYPTACVWGSGGEDVLGWLDVPVNRRTWRESALDADDQRALHGLILLDLPDHDSTEVEHRIESDRLVELVDVLFWVVDPQKYADQALHQHYLSQLAGHGATMVVVLNQVDKLNPEERKATADHLRSLLAEDGLPDAPVQLASAVTHEGVRELRTLLSKTIEARQAALERLAADARAMAERISAQLGTPVADIPQAMRADQLIDAMNEAAGVPALTETVRDDYLRRSYAATGYPPLAWSQRTRPDPLGNRHGNETRADLVRAAAPATTKAQRSRVSLASHALVDRVTAGLPAPWQAQITSAQRGSTDRLTATLDDAITSVDISPQRPGWWPLAGFLQVLFFVFTVVGVLWLIVQAVLSLVVPEAVSGALWWVVPIVVLVVGIIGSVVTSLVARSARQRGADAVAQEAHARLSDAVSSAANDAYLAPITDILNRHQRIVGELAPTSRP